MQVIADISIQIHKNPHKRSSFSFHFLDGSASLRVMVSKHVHVNINQNFGVCDCWETAHFLFTFPHWHFTFPSLVHLHKYTHTSTHLHYRREGRGDRGFIWVKDWCNCSANCSIFPINYYFTHVVVISCSHVNISVTIYTCMNLMRNNWWRAVESLENNTL